MIKMILAFLAGGLCASLTIAFLASVREDEDLIRCKDCKWFGDTGCAVRIVDDSDNPNENDFCSFAERKNNG